MEPLAEAMESDLAPASLSGALPFAYAKSHDVLLDWRNDQPILVYTGELQANVLLEVRRHLGQRFTVELVSPEFFQRRLTEAYQRTNNEAAQMAEDIGADVDLSRLVDQLPDLGDLMDAEDDAPIIRLINAILSQAVKEKASDIHIETFEDHLSVRYRVDGVLTEVLSPKRMLAPLLVSAEGDGKTGYRRKACAAGWPNFCAHCGSRY